MLSTFVTEKHIIPDNQYGFKPGHSTQHALLKLHHDVTISLNSKSCTLTAFLDIEKAFDKVWTRGLIYKMIKFEFPLYLVKIILDFLNNRFFQIKINQEFSSMKAIYAGVPQGSILSPLLFNIFISDAPRPLPNCMIQFYADDAVCYSSERNACKAARQLNSMVSNLEKFYTNWGIKLNIDKTELIMFRPPITGRSTHSIRSFNISGRLMEVKNSVKYLGITFTKLFKFNPHIDRILKNANYAYHILNPLMRKKSLSQNCKLLLYKQIIRPTFTHGFPTFITISKTYVEKIKKFERKMLRVCTGLYRKDDSLHFYSNKKLYDTSELQDIENFFKKICINFINRLPFLNNNLIDNVINHNTQQHNNTYYHLNDLNISLTNPEFSIFDLPNEVRRG